MPPLFLFVDAVFHLEVKAGAVEVGSCYKNLRTSSFFGGRASRALGVVKVSLVTRGNPEQHCMDFSLGTWKDFSLF